MDTGAVLSELTCGGFTASEDDIYTVEAEVGDALFRTWATPDTSVETEGTAIPVGRTEDDGTSVWALHWRVNDAPVTFAVGVQPAILVELGEQLAEGASRFGASSQSIEDVTIAYADWSPQSLLEGDSLWTAAVRKWSLCDTSGSVSYQFDEDDVRRSWGSSRLW